MYSVNEFKNDERRENWNRYKDNFFDSPESFDQARSAFENLSLLDSSNNSSANDKIVEKKLDIYLNAKAVIGSSQEYLIQSFVKNSPFYTNIDLLSLNLPERAIIRKEENTWEHSKNNKDFTEKLLKLANSKF